MGETDIRIFQGAKAKYGGPISLKRPLDYTTPIVLAGRQFHLDATRATKQCLRHWCVDFKWVAAGIGGQRDDPISQRAGPVTVREP